MSKGTTARKELKNPDEFVSLFGRFLDFYEENKTTFWAVIALVVIIAFGSWGYFYAKDKKVQKYQYLIGKQVDAFNEWMSGDEHDIKKLDPIKDELQALSEGAPENLHFISMYYLSRILFEQNKFDTAISVLEEIKPKVKENVLKVTVYYDLYKMYATIHNYKKALEIIEDALDNLEANPYEQNMINDKKRYKQYILWTEKTQMPQLKDTLQKLKDKLKVKPKANVNTEKK